MDLYYSLKITDAHTVLLHFVSPSESASFLLFCIYLFMIFFCKRAATSLVCSNAVAWNLQPICWCRALKLLSVPVWGTPATSSGPELVGATDRVHLCCHWWDWGKGRAEKALFSTWICISEIEKPWQDLLEMSCLHVVCSWVKVAGQVKNTSSRDWLQ